MQGVTFGVTIVSLQAHRCLHTKYIEKVTAALWSISSTQVMCVTSGSKAATLPFYKELFLIHIFPNILSSCVFVCFAVLLTYMLTSCGTAVIMGARF